MSQMIEVKTAELTKHALNWAVAKADEKDVHVTPAGRVVNKTSYQHGSFIVYSPSTDWAQGGPLIEKYAILFMGEQGFDEPDVFFAIIRSLEAVGRGETHLIAACRAIVAAKLGDVVSVPAELVGGEK